MAFRRRLPARPALERLTVRARGIDFAVYRTPVVGVKVPLLCVNGGLLFDHSLLWPALGLLAASRQLIFYDQRGRGQSATPPGIGASRIEFDAGDIPALQAAMGIPQWDILGHSWGGGISMLAVAGYNATEMMAQAAAQTGANVAQPAPPNSPIKPAIRRLVLVDPVGATSEWLPPLHDAGLARLSGRAYDRLNAFDPERLSAPDLNYHAAYAQAFFPAWFADQSFAASVNPPLGTSQTGAVVAARLRSQGYDWRDKLRDLGVPTLVVHGAADVLPLSEAQRTVSLLGNARLVPIADAGHNPFWEAPDAFFDSVLSFLDEDSAPH